MYFRVSHQSQRRLYQRTNQIACQKIRWYLHTLIWRHVSLKYVVQSNILWLTILVSYHYRRNVVFANYRFPVSFLLYIATQNLTKSLLWTVLRILLSPKRITLARFACLCLFKKGDRTLLRNWRPVLLLTTEYKILTKALANRIQHVLPLILNSDKTGCIKGRTINGNTRLLNDVISYVNEKNTGLFSSVLAKWRPLTEFPTNF